MALCPDNEPQPPQPHIRTRKGNGNDDYGKVFMKTTKYCDFRRQKTYRKNIKDEWIQRVIDYSIGKEVQSDGRIKI